MPAQKPIDWNRRARRALDRLLDAAQQFPALRKRGPRISRTSEGWQAGVRVVGSTEIRRLNSHYRGKNSPTDVLSFGSPEPFWSLGHLGELVIALPVLKAQARSLGHSAEVELWVLLAHGLLHLLGMDHEKGTRQAREQKAWEARLLTLTGLEAGHGLIQRTLKKPSRRKP